jgi:hypothetical protein
MKLEKSTNPADLGKKVFPGVERFRSRSIRDSRISETEGITFFPVSKILFNEALSPP